MTGEQLKRIPSHLLAARSTAPLREWLADRGLTLSLLDLDNERRRRGLCKRRSS